MGCILVTGIGGNVGQGILRNIRSFDPNLRLIGTDVRPVTGGNYLCDEVHQTPVASAPNFAAAIKKICRKSGVQLIIPSTDVEGYHLSLNTKELPTLAFPVPATNMMFWDKYSTWQHFTKNKIPFAESCLPSEWKGQFKKYIVKPKRGQGSKNLHFNPPNVKEFSDATFVVQNLYEGEEITTAFYVTKKRKMHGSITFRRQLQTGFTAICEVTHDFDKRLFSIMNAMAEIFEIAGACNIQSIALPDGRIYPFEINGRISGTNSIRSQFGFKDVQYTVEEYLLGKDPSPVHITPGCAARVLLDVIFPGQSLSEVKNKNSRFYIY